MMFTADQIVAHLIGDYVLQSHWMATQKTKEYFAAGLHALAYSMVFAFWFDPSFNSWMVIFGTHLLIDRYRLARYVVWAKNCLGVNRPWRECSATGFAPDVPAWLAVWLLIIVDNILHLCINAAALRWL